MTCKHDIVVLWVIEVGDAWKANLADHYSVLQSWDPTLANPCTWFHVTWTLAMLDFRDNLFLSLEPLANFQYL
ncbi:somatic embryogenesis receptor kinase 2 [Quercus suber]|uniref:Somatic embryogenesis receptor kinase 2 n=1 Tax=Quercus suber TaxID=58331 RepID=A0AAW0LAC4_QUESU